MKHTHLSRAVRTKMFRLVPSFLSPFVSQVKRGEKYVKFSLFNYSSHILSLSVGQTDEDILPASLCELIFAMCVLMQFCLSYIAIDPFLFSCKVIAWVLLSRSIHSPSNLGDFHSEMCLLTPSTLVGVNSSKLVPRVLRKYNFNRHPSKIKTWRQRGHLCQL